MAATLARAGYDVVAIARKQSAELARLEVEQAGRVRFVAWDLGEIGSLGELARKVRELHGVIWGLVNNAGIGTAGVLSTLPDSKIEELVRLNVLSPITLGSVPDAAAAASAPDPWRKWPQRTFAAGAASGTHQFTVRRHRAEAARHHSQRGRAWFHAH
jgi:NAD(P)-dependent dehydrogenase (short-subunit alcohol dehydrogenase family)